MAIGGLGDVQTSVSAGLAAQPLVTSADPNVVGPAAVEQLTNAYREGFITNQDILDRIGQVGQAKKKALLESLGEYVNPDVIQSRLAQAQATGAQAKLATAQAQGAQALVQPQVKAALTQADLAAYNPMDQEAIQAFGTFNPIPKKDDGTYDYDKILAAGYDYKGAFRKLEIAMKGLAVGQPIITTDPTTKQPITTFTNGFNQPRTPELVKMYSDMQREAFEDAYGIRSQRATDHGTNVPESGAPPNWLETTPGSVATPAAPAASVSPAPASTPLPAQLVQPAATTVSVQPTGQVMIQPASNPSFAAMPPDMAAASMFSGPPPGMLPAERQTRVAQIQNDAISDPRVKNWLIAQQYIEPFKQRAEQLASLSDEQQQKENLAIVDQGMLENIIKMYDPQGVMREFKWEKLEENQDRLQKYLNLKNVIQRVSGRATLTPDARRRIVDMGYESINGMERAAQPVLQRAKQLGEQFQLGNPLDLKQDAVAQGVFSENPMKLPPMGSGAPASAGSKTGAAPAQAGVVVFKSGPYAGRAMRPNGDGSYSPVQ